MSQALAHTPGDFGQRRLLHGSPRALLVGALVWLAWEQGGCHGENGRQTVSSYANPRLRGRRLRKIDSQGPLTVCSSVLGSYPSVTQQNGPYRASIFRRTPGVIVLLRRRFRLLILSTVVSYSFAIPKSVSPRFTR